MGVTCIEDSIWRLRKRTLRMDARKSCREHGK
jgi:hypothetical protein